MFAAHSGNNTGVSMPQRGTTPLRFFAVLLIIGWTTAIALSFWYNSNKLTEHALDSARIQARTAVEKDVVYRQWNSIHNGVYVPVVPGKFEPNPYLPEKGRVIVDQEGRAFTKINPAYMTRLVHEIGVLRTGAIGHITSTRPIRKGNEPDAWEVDALALLESRSTDEVSGATVINGSDYMRLMRGLDTEPSCMNCHAHQGYKVGDVRGGISVAVPMQPFMAATEASRRTLFGTHAGIWLVGLLGIGTAVRRIGSGLKERDRAELELRDLTAELELRVVERTQALKIRQMELEAFIDNADAGFFLKDVNGHFRICNRQFAAILEKEPDDVIGRTNAELLDAQSAARLSGHEKLIVCNDVSAELQRGFISPKNEWYSCFSFPLKEDGRIVGVGGMVVNMTERDKVEQALREARDAAEKASRAKSDFLANMSHEIRTPLNGVIGMADLLLRTRLDSDQASMAAAIKTSGDSLLLVLNDVLDISKIEAGKLVFEHIPFRLRDTLFDSIKGLTPIAYKKSIELILHVSPMVPEHLIGDPIRIRQILLNLVNNALKFTDEGEVVVTVLLVSSTKASARLRFSVTDTGIGIPKEKQALVFKAFEQVDSSTTRKYGGSGLGLAICARLLEAMGSKIELKSHENFGSSFWFEIDLPVDHGSGPALKPIVRSDALAGKKILLVDDNDTNLHILNETLGNWGMEVASASGADEALALAELAVETKRPFDIILTDLQMPGKDGVDFLRMLRRRPAFSSLPVILLSSGTPPERPRDNPESAEFFAAALDKPVKPEALMRAIASALNMWESYDVHELQREVELLSAANSQQGLRVLLAEDVEMNQMVAARMLKELGHASVVVGDGKAAVEAVIDQNFDLVLMDIQMPVMDGVQATRLIRDMEEAGELKKRNIIIAMTAHALKGDRDKYLNAGMDAYLAKPILLEDLRAVIDAVVNPDNADAKTPPVNLSWCAVSASVHGEGAKPEPDGGAADGGSSGNGEDDELIDWALVERGFSGNHDFIADSMHLYMRDAPKLLQEAVEAGERMDNASLTVSAHALKGITGYFTRRTTYSLCLAIEEAGRENALPDRKGELDRMFSELRAQVNQLIAEMDAYITRNPA